MNVQIRTVHFDADQKLRQRVNEKLQKLATFHDRIVEVEVYLKLDNIAKNIKDKVAEIIVRVPGRAFFVKHESKTFEESFDLAFNSMVNQIKRQKQKLVAA